MRQRQQVSHESRQVLRIRFTWLGASLRPTNHRATLFVYPEILALPTPHSTFHIPHSSFHIPHSSFHIPHPTFHVQRSSMLLRPPSQCQQKGGTRRGFHPKTTALDDTRSSPPHRCPQAKSNGASSSHPGSDVALPIVRSQLATRPSAHSSFVHPLRNKEGGSNEHLPQLCCLIPLPPPALLPNLPIPRYSSM